jgi:IS30 family transposase
MARPRKEISQQEFEKLCKLQCTQQEIADWFDCSPDTIERWCQREYNKRFAEVFAQNRGKGKISLRRMQWQLAEKSPAMAIFLGKNMLGQTDKMEQIVNDVSEHKGITINFADKGDSNAGNVPDSV